MRILIYYRLIMDNIEELKKNYLNLKEEHENTKQELHECKRNIKIMYSTQEDYKNEIDMLQSEEIKQKQKYQEIIRHLEQNINDVRSKHCEEIQTFEDLIVKMEGQSDKLKSELYVFKDANTTNFRGDTSSLIQEILSETTECFENQELRAKLQELTDANKALEVKVQEYGRELDNLKESYENKKSDLNEAMETNTFLVDENVILKSELDLLKSQPLNKDSKGNSLFAEVNDRRVYLQDQINKMKSSYVAMTQEKTQLQNIVHHLKLENLRLLEKWKADIAEVEDDADEIRSSLRSRNNALEKLIEQYTRELAEKQWIVSKIGAQEIEFFEMMLNDKKAEIKSLREELLNKTLAQMSFAKELTAARNEKRKWRLEAMVKQHELELLQRTEETYSSNKNKEKTDTKDIDQQYVSRKDSEITKEELSDAKEDSYGELKTLNANVDNNRRRNTGLENPKVPESSLDQSRKVTFANDTVSPKRTARRNCKVISRPPVEL